ncbi:peptidoglycan-binding domain-containing protein [Methanobrevibacter curvatus]|uniref:Putative peptidoglycan binding domain protein n=1 Tax=Methanobrevibacter curvatus TaxID=49547 RepID=A0A166CB51_9EURY|nr:peptidoglycan-binding protein [Methanobrevibacter curvatus]KZX14323.1 putative peptidoglycan binding domain protein [Methanobrevibacter curvatus]
MAYEIYLDNNFIGDNLGISESNNIDLQYSDSTTGNALLTARKLKSRLWSFDFVMDLNKDYNDKKALFDSLKEKILKEEISFVCLHEGVASISAWVVILSITPDYSVDNVVTYSVEVLEYKKPVKTVIKFNTFNYKPATVKTTPAKTKKSTILSKNNPYVLELLKCNPVFNCKNRNQKCVSLLQRLLQMDGYYTKFRVDSWFCDKTLKELKKWQKNKAKIKVTGKFDNATKNYLKKRFNIK